MEAMSEKGILVVIGVAVVSGVAGVSLSPANAAVIIGFVSMVCVQLFGQLRARVDAAHVARKAEEVKTALVETNSEVKGALVDTNAEVKRQLNEIQAVGARTERYCNSALGRALRVAATATAAMASRAGATESEKLAATIAARELQDHEGKQASLDADDVKGHQV